MNVALSAEIVKILESMFKIFFGSVLTFLNVKGLQLQLVFLPKLWFEIENINLNRNN